MGVTNYLLTGMILQVGYGRLGKGNEKVFQASLLILLATSRGTFSKGAQDVENGSLKNDDFSLVLGPIFH